MSPSARPSRLGGANGYRRPSLDVLDDLTNPGHPGTRDDQGTSGAPGPQGVEEVRLIGGPPGVSDTRGALDTSGAVIPLVVQDTSDDGGTSDASDDSGSGGTSVTEVPSVAQETSVGGGISDTAGNSEDGGTEGPRGTSDPQGARKAEPRDHVKLARSLADEMRDAVWFLSEHGRPRVQLGELLDEAVRSWLDAAKAQHNKGERFPVRGRLR
jgi:hypothetical protein